MFFERPLSHILPWLLQCGRAGKARDGTPFSCGVPAFEAYLPGSLQYEIMGGLAEAAIFWKG